MVDEEKAMQEILAALQSINITCNISGSQTLQKLSAVFQLNSESWLEVDFSRWGNKEPDTEKFELLKSAVIHRKSKAWYLKAFCTDRQDLRIFKLNRIIDLESLIERRYGYRRTAI